MVAEWTGGIVKIHLSKIARICEGVLSSWIVVKGNNVGNGIDNDDD